MRDLTKAEPEEPLIDEKSISDIDRQVELAYAGDATGYRLRYAEAEPARPQAC